MPNLNVKGEMSRPSAASGGSGGGIPKVVIIVIIAIVAVGAVLFILNTTGVVKLWGKKKPAPIVVNLPPTEEYSMLDTAIQQPEDTLPDANAAEPKMEENLTKLESNAQFRSSAGAAKKMIVTGTGMYTIQISSWPSEEKANAQAQLFNDAGFEAFVEPLGSYYRVCIGRYESKSDAKAQAEKMEHMLESKYVIAKAGK